MKQLIVLFNQGGILMPLIAGVSIAAWLLTLKTWRTTKLILTDLTSAKNSIYNVCKRDGKINRQVKTLCLSPPAKWITDEISHNGLLHESRREKTKLVFENELTKLECSLNLLAGLAAVLPLLGLLGTVFGMLATFDVIQIHGTGRPGLLSNGISEALLTTEAGLSTALPVLFFHHLLSIRLRKIDGELNLVFHESETMCKNSEQQEIKT